jgi:hypothetical protein
MPDLNMLASPAKAQSPANEVVGACKSPKKENAVEHHAAEPAQKKQKKQKKQNNDGMRWNFLNTKLGENFFTQGCISASPLHSLWNAMQNCDSTNATAASREFVPRLLLLKVKCSKSLFRENWPMIRLSSFNWKTGVGEMPAKVKREPTKVKAETPTKAPAVQQPQPTPVAASAASVQTPLKADGTCPTVVHSESMDLSPTTLTIVPYRDSTQPSGQSVWFPIPQDKDPRKIILGDGSSMMVDVEQMTAASTVVAELVQNGANPIYLTDCKPEDVVAIVMHINHMPALSADLLPGAILAADQLGCTSSIVSCEQAANTSGRARAVSEGLLPPRLPGHCHRYGELVEEAAVKDRGRSHSKGKRS